jgi:hypothetical protein
MTTVEPSDIALLADLARVNKARRKAERASEDAMTQEVAIIAKLRERRVTWTRIAETLGRKQPNVVATYRHRLVQTETRTVTVRQPAD